jgi:hypothetical protein
MAILAMDWHGQDARGTSCPWHFLQKASRLRYNFLGLRECSLDSEQAQIRAAANWCLPAVFLFFAMLSTMQEAVRNLHLAEGAR